MPTEAPYRDAQSRLLKKHYGFENLHHEQQMAVDHVLHGRDVSVTAPTGFGKSICFILPALVNYYAPHTTLTARPGQLDPYRRAITVVISPLLALIADQVAGLRRRSIPVAVISSGESAAQNRKTTSILANGTSPPFALLYVTAERVTSAAFLNTLTRVQKSGRLAGFAIDESHCISQWGHDFRKSYSQLGVLKTSFPSVPVIALTATATPDVEDSIVKSLCIPDAIRVHKSFLRENIRYEVRYVDGELCGRRVVPDMIEYVLQRPDAAGVVYAHTRAQVEEIVEEMSHAGIRCAGYHGGLTPKTRREVQDKFQTNSLQLIVATTAFGMGIDKPDVRFVLNHSLPSSIEAYYQESGRAGRDGKPSDAILYYSAEDANWRKRLASQSVLSDANRGHDLAKVAVSAVDAIESYCTKVKCRRAHLLEHFHERCSASDICGPHGCDVCASRSDVLRRKNPAMKKRGSQDVSYKSYAGPGRFGGLQSPAAAFHSARTLEKESGPVDEITTWADDYEQNDSLGIAEEPGLTAADESDLASIAAENSSTILELAQAEEAQALAENVERGKGPQARILRRLREQPATTFTGFRTASSLATGFDSRHQGKALVDDAKRFRSSAPPPKRFRLGSKR